jgi:hypothetical protein
MTIEDMEKAFIGFGAACIAGLVSLVRGGDIKRIEAIEKRQELQDGHIANEVHALRSEMRDNHSEVMALLVERNK